MRLLESLELPQWAGVWPLSTLVKACIPITARLGGISIVALESARKPLDWHHNPYSPHQRAASMILIPSID